MQHHCDEDSGRSSCSAISMGLSPVIEYKKCEKEKIIVRNKTTKNTDTHGELKVSKRPRSYIGLLKSPDEKDPFPSYRVTRPLRSIFNASLPSGLAQTQSTLELSSSTKIEQPVMKNNAISLKTVIDDDEIKPKSKNQVNTNFKRGKPVQRAASRLYKTDNCSKGKDFCTGPEFIIRASQPPKQIDLSNSIITDKRLINVVLLNGQKVDVICDPNTITVGLLFETLVKSETYEHSFMLGIAVLIGGDFAFLPDEYKIKKIAPEEWSKSNSKKSKVALDETLTVFLRIKFFLPTNIAKNIQDGEWRHRVYLQLRRSTVEGQLTSTMQNYIVLAGYALHIEFGEFSFREHGTADYFLLEHYLPEMAITNDMSDVKLKMKKAHESKRGLEREKAIVNFITLAQTFRDYGSHFYSAIWATRDGFCRDVWLSIGPRGITLYSRTNVVSNTDIETDTLTHRIVLQSLPWHHIHTFYFNKKSLYVMPNSNSGLSKIGVKYKLKMQDKKSYFTFWLASLHHRLYLKLYAKDDYLSDELGCILRRESPKKQNSFDDQDSYNLAVRNPIRSRRPVRKKFKVDFFNDKKNQDKENEKPSTEDLLRQILFPQPNDSLNSVNANGNSSNDGISSSESCSLPRRQGVKMGTRVFNGMKKLNSYPTSSNLISSNEYLKSDVDITTNLSDSDDVSCEQRQHCSVNSMKLLPERGYESHGPTAYVLESPKVYPEVFNFNATSSESCLNASIFEKLDNMGCVQGDRIFVTALIKRDDMNTLGLQVAEGSDGNIYIKSITNHGPADRCKKLLPGDQIISVNGKTLLNIKYEKALKMLQTAPQIVELIVLQNTSKNSTDSSFNKNEQNRHTSLKNLSQSFGSALDIEITDDELLNEEALKTIYALIKLTKDKVISRIKDKNHKQKAPSNLLKCYSESLVYEEPDLGNYSSQESTPKKENSSKFNTWRGLPSSYTRPKHRPLSLSIPNDIDFTEEYLSKVDDIMKRSSLKSIQSSLTSLDKSIKSNSSKNVALPRNFAHSRKWLGPVKYPVTPCKNSNSNSAISGDDIIRKHFNYGAGESDDEQIFL